MAKRKKAANQSGQPRATSKSDPPSRSRSVVAEPASDWGIAMHISWWAVLAMVFITPLAIANLRFIGIDLPISYDQFDIVKVLVQRIFSFIALAAWAWEVFVRGGRIRWTPVEGLILLFLAWVAVSTVLSIHPATAFFGKYRRFEGLYSFIDYALMYFLVLQMADRPARLRQLARTIFATGFLVALYGVLQYLGKDFLQWGALPFEQNRAFSTYGNPDLLGGFLMFSLFISLGLVFSERNRWVRGLYWAGVLLNSVCIIVAFTRSAWVGTVVGVFFFIIIAIAQRMKWIAEDWVFSGGALAGVIWPIVKSMSASNTNDVMNFGKRVASIFQFGEGSAKTRFEIWEAAWRGIKARPVFGFGPDTFRLVFPKYKPVEYVKDAGYLSVADNVHNYPLQLAVGVGVPGVAMLYGIFGWAAVRSAKVLFSRDGGPDRALLAGFWAACAAYVAHLCFGLSVTGTSFLMWISMAALLAPTAKSFRVKAPAWGVIIALLFSALAVFVVVDQANAMRADKQYLLSRVYYARGSQERVDAARRAVEINPYNDMYRSEVGLALLEGAQSAADSNTRIALIAEAEESLLDTIDFIPAEYDNYVFLASLYVTAGYSVGDAVYYQRAVDICEKGIEVEENGPAIRLQYAIALSSLGRTDDAIRQFEIAHKMDPAYEENALELENTYRRVGRLDLAVKMYKESYEWTKSSYFAAQYADVLNESGDPEAALAVLEKVVNATPLDPIVVKPYADILVAQGLYQEALAVLQAALAANPSDQELYSRIASAQAGMTATGTVAP